MTDEYTKREDAIQAFVNEFECILDLLESIPSADVRPVVHGEWEFEYENLDEQIEYRCSVCDWIGVNANEFRYCPNCGAKMEVQYG